MDFWNAVGFHTEAIASSLGESVSDLAVGTWGLLTETSPERASESYYATRDAIDEYIPGLGPILGGVIAPLSYALNITVIPSGEAIGGGIGMAVYGRNAEEMALGITQAFGGIGAACSVVAGVLAPKPIINISSIQVSGLGELALAPAISVEVAGVASATGAAGATILNGGLLFNEAQKSGWDELFNRYGGELLRDRKSGSQSSGIMFRTSKYERELVRSLVEESGLDMTTVIKIALRFLRDKVASAPQ